MERAMETGLMRELWDVEAQSMTSYSTFCMWARNAAVRSESDFSKFPQSLYQTLSLPSFRHFWGEVVVELSALSNPGHLARTLGWACAASEGLAFWPLWLFLIVSVDAILGSSPLYYPPYTPPLRSLDYGSYRVLIRCGE